MNSSQFLIATDSLSSINTLMNQFTKHPIAQRLRFTLFELIKIGKKVQFCWIPSHRGIPGNEAVDSKAKTATSRDPELIPIYYRDYYSLVQTKIHQKWATMWSQSGDKLRELVPVPHPITRNNLSRKQEVTLNRIITGHTLLTHGYLMDSSSPDIPPICHLCNNAVLSIKHLFVSCQATEPYRSLHFGGLSHKDLLLNNAQKVLLFLEKFSLLSLI